MIKLLSDETIQKIAAGEVIERPGSIVKELVENSIDANADTITVEIKDGGKSLIKIIDNGEGMSKTDLPVAFQRHATSKLKNFNDLYEIYSLGFRGEALASVIAVANVQIKTRTKEDKMGSSLIIENGVYSEINPVAMNIGTVIEVTNLFENIPVRKKFLRKDSTEANIITNMMYRFALSHSKISFKYIKDNRIVFETVSGELRDSLRALFDNTLVNNLIEIDIKNRNYSLRGLISNNNYYRGNRGIQYLFVNGRYIENKEIQRAIEDNYISVIPNGKYPVYQLFLELPPSLIDVNIHPNKQKIKINIIDDILDSIKKDLKDQLKNGIDIPNIEIKDRKNRIMDFTVKESHNEKEIIEKVYGKAPKFPKDSYNLFSSQNFQKEKTDLSAANIHEEKDKDQSMDLPTVNPEIQEMQEEYWIEEKQTDEVSSQINMLEEDSETGDQSRFPKTDNCYIIGTLFNTYILFQENGKENLYLLDQHAAHERILYEKYFNKFKEGSILSQQLSSPFILSLRDEEIKNFENNRELFFDLGFEIDLFDDSHLILRSLPVILGKVEGERLLNEILDNIGNQHNIDSIRDRIIMKSCKAAVKAGDPLSAMEIKELLKNLENTKFPYTCPHGRPTIIEISKRDIEKLFSRIK